MFKEINYGQSEVRIGLIYHGFTQLFKIEGYSDEAAKALSRSLHRSIRSRYPDELINNQGNLEFSERTFQMAMKLNQVLKEIRYNSDAIKLPERRSECDEFVEILTEGLIGREICLIVPVCPDYGKGENFYRQMGEGISPEAKGGIEAVKALIPILEKVKIKTNVEILVADTETDIPEIIQSCAGGDENKYLRRCRLSRDMIADELINFPEVKVMTFTEKFGDNFYTIQKEFEEKIRLVMKKDKAFGQMIEDVSSRRAARHTQILGRQEKDLELSVRYAAQYAAMGRMLKTGGKVNGVLNYRTPNREYFNAAINVHKEIFIDDSDNKVIPVLGSEVVREIK